jgi:hypothetical protein
VSTNLNPIKKKSSNCLTLLVDTAESREPGHNYVYSGKFRETYEKCNLEYVFISPSADLALNEDGLLRRINYGSYVKTLNSDESNSDIFKKIEEQLVSNHYGFYHIFFLWGHQLSDANVKHLKELILNSPIKTQVNILAKFPNILGRIEKKNTAREIGFINQFNDFRCSVQFYTWDKKAEKKLHPKVKYLTEYITYPKQASSSLRKNRQQEVSFFGNLSYFRGLSRFLVLALFNPRINFQIIGSSQVDLGFYRKPNYVGAKKNPLSAIIGLSYSFFFLMLTKLQNVKYIPNKVFIHHSDLEAIVENSKYIFISTKRTGLDSGIARMALCFNIPIIWEDGNSPINDLLKEIYPQGKLKPFQFKIKKLLNNLDQLPLPTAPNTEHKFSEQILDMCGAHFDEI